MPRAIITWLSAVMPPLRALGDCSEMYMGATKDAVPTASPSTKRAMQTSSTLGPKAEPKAATVKMQPARHLVHLRLMASANQPLAAAPATAPMSSDPTTQDSPNEPMPSDLEKYGSALPTTPVSKPKRKPPRAARAAIHAT